MSRQRLAWKLKLVSCGLLKMKNTSFIRRNREQLGILEGKLVEQLYNYKQLLARTGRGEVDVVLTRPRHYRASADRWVQAHERSLSPQPLKRLPEAFSGPSHDEIAALVKKLKPGLACVLTTPHSIAQFLIEMSTALNSTTAVS